MRKRITSGLLLAVAAGALLLTPVSAAGRGTSVTRNDSAINESCVIAALSVEVDASFIVTDVPHVRSLWVFKQNGRNSKLFCRFKRATVDLGTARVIRLRGADALPYCPEMDGVGDPLYAKFKMNRRGNGFLKCVYAPEVV